MILLPGCPCCGTDCSCGPGCDRFISGDGTFSPPLSVEVDITAVDYFCHAQWSIANSGCASNTANGFWGVRAADVAGTYSLTRISATTTRADYRYERVATGTTPLAEYILVTAGISRAFVTDQMITSVSVNITKKSWGYFNWQGVTMTADELALKPASWTVPVCHNRSELQHRGNFSSTCDKPTNTMGSWGGTSQIIRPTAVPGDYTTVSETGPHLGSNVWGVACMRCS